MKPILFALALISVSILSCREVQLYERLQNIPGANWEGSKTPEFTFNITDTTIAYKVYVVIRHTNQYPYRNMWLNVGLQQPGDTIRHQKFEVQLAGPDRWLGTGMDDIYEHRALMFNEPVRFNRVGTIQFTLEQIMRRDPLPGVMQAGIRVEPVG